MLVPLVNLVLLYVVAFSEWKARPRKRCSFAISIADSSLWLYLFCNRLSHSRSVFYARIGISFSAKPPDPEMIRRIFMMIVPIMLVFSS